MRRWKTSPSVDSKNSSLVQKTSLIPNSDLRYLRGIGPKRAQILSKLEIYSLHDLLRHFPQRYEDRSRFVQVAQLQDEQIATVKLEILKATLKPIPRLPMVEIIAGDESGTVTAVWYRQTYLLKQFKPGLSMLLYGKAETKSGKIHFSNPDFELMDEKGPSIHTGRIVPIYGLTEGLYQKTIRSVLHEITQTNTPFIADALSPAILSAQNLIPLDQALKWIHFPETLDQLEQARKRLIFDEFFSFQLNLQSEIKKSRQRTDGIILKNFDNISKKFSSTLPFTLTQAQQRAIHEIYSDLQLSRPMHRLLQGDVGSGKTVVACAAFLAAQQGGVQSAFLVPTEILAEQHFATLRKFLEPFKVRLTLLTKSTEKKRRERMLAEIKQSKLDVIVGTHALLQSDVQFGKLGLVVIDEQHKFGVEQRNQLLNRQPAPHFLIMTATPIPRSLALAIYANADFSSIRELPVGRKPIQTYWISRNRQSEVWEHLRGKLREGRQAYVVFPLIEESEKADLKAAEIEYKRLKNSVFKEFQVALVHGKIASEERARIMRQFSNREVDLLVSTTVIEVGVDQPNATVMIIENAERFGLAQLHQLRGRIGRGEHASECYLFGEPTTDDGKARLRLLTRVQDGFQIAEEDLKLRGPGDLWGLRQSGVPHFKLAHPIWNEDILKSAKTLAEHWMNDQPEASWIKKYLAENLRSY